MTRTGDLRTLVGFVVALVILAGIAVTTYRSARQALDDDELVEHTYQVLAKLQDLLATVVDVETMVRGFTITGEDDFLESYDRRQREVPDRIAELKALLQTHPTQLQRMNALEPIVGEKIAFMATQIVARRTQGAEAAAAIVRSGTGRTLMDSIRAAVETMANEEQALLAERLDRIERSHRLAMVVIVVGNIVACLFLAGAITVIYQENAQRRRAEKRAVQDRDRLDLILNSLGEGIVAVDARGRFTMFNPAAAAMLGVGPTDSPHEERPARYGLFLPDRATPYPAEQTPLARTLRGENCQDVEMFVRNPNRPDGVVLSATGRPLRDASGAVTGGVVVLSDISAQKGHEDAIERKNDELAHAYAELDRTRLSQLQTKDQLLSHVSHELRTPLTAAHQFVEILRDGVAGPLNEEQLEYSEIALRNLKQLRAMIGDLLDATRVESAKLAIEPARMSLKDVVRDVCRSLYSPAAERRISLQNRVGELPDVLADAGRVRQILTNLLHNAVKFTEDGSIFVDAVVVGDDRRFVQLTVADTGSGMSPETLSRIFTRLYQGAEQWVDSRRGLGLGLYICKELVTRQGGEIWVESELGKGSSFHCTFPVFTEREASLEGA